LAIPDAPAEAEGDSLAGAEADGDADPLAADGFPLFPPHAESTAAHVKTKTIPSAHDLFILFIFFLPDFLFFFTFMEAFRHRCNSNIRTRYL
jgi:hypothetical protein